MIYLDNAATTWPKAPGVAEAIARHLELAGGNPGRSGHRLSVEAARDVYAAREAVAGLLGVEDPLRVIFTANATHALNLALRGLLRPGDRVVTSGMEHNAVMRPLRALPEEEIDLHVVPCAPDGALDPRDVARAVEKRTRLVVLNHASNVSGTLQPVGEIARLAREAGALLLVDAAQTAGTVPIDVTGDSIDLLAFTGHKGLLGPAGTGGLVIGPDLDPMEIDPLVRGGTGSRSEREEQPERLPDRFESGTPNGPGLAGLLAGVLHVRSRGVEAVLERARRLADTIHRGLMEIPGASVLGPAEPERRTGVVSFIVDGRSVSEIGGRLDEEHEVLCRVGLHCAPSAHRTLGTFPEGTVRFAPGPFTTEEEVDQAIRSVAEVVG